VLADAPSQPSGQQGLTVGEAMQAATAGVQDYQRVHVGSSTLPTRISDEAAADVVHLLTELVDNALAYSPPASPVAIGSSLRGDGVLLDIIDGGLGIPDDALAALNERLRSGATISADSTRRMGLFVVARLAQRHGIDVELNRNGQGGTTATVHLPTAILPDLREASPAVTTPVADTGALAETAQAPDAARSAPAPATLSAVGAVGGEAAVDTAARSRLEAVLGGALGSGLSGGPGGLPTRRPGASLADSPAAPLTPIGAPVTPATPVAPVAPVTPVATAEPVRPAPAPEPVQPDVPALVRHADPLGGDYVPEPADADDFDTPIFRAMRSAWLSAGGEGQPWRTTEIEEGWQLAERAVEAPPTELAESGLPQRRPGAALVPGGVTKEAGSIARDPEAIRARLAAHAAGVSRGRRAATAPTTDHQHTEADTV
jgi:anti-sigma regulatory factor (Ser/Thr protein kinase)